MIVKSINRTMTMDQYETPTLYQPVEGINQSNQLLIILNSKKLTILMFILEYFH